MRYSFIALAAILAGCGVSVPHDQDVGAELAALSRRPGNGYFAGERFAGLPLTAVEGTTAGRAAFIYGTCEIPFGQDGGCAPPVQIQNFPFSPLDWSRAYGCRRRPSLRGVTTVRHDGLVLFTGRRVVKIYARNPAEDRRVALTLRAVGASAPAELPKTPPAVRRLVARVCR